MSDPIGWLAIGASCALLVLVLELVRRRALAEEYSLVWIGLCVCLLVISVRRSLLDSLAAMLGVHYPPAILPLVLILFGFIGALFFTVVVSRQRKQIERLVEDTALLQAELREVRKTLDARR
jgi:hypothetical protein